MYKFNFMFRLNKLLLRTLLLMLMLFVGPLHAQILYACTEIEKSVDMAMHNTQDMAKHSTNLCNAHQDCVNLDCEGALDSNEGLCCEGSAALSINPDLQQNLPAINLVELESDVDPPQATVTTLSLFSPTQIFAIPVVSPRINSGQPGSNTYLITQRLRI